MKTYLSCEVRRGQFGAEWAVRGVTVSGAGFSFFAPNEYVELDKARSNSEGGLGWIRVEVLEEDEHRALVRLPGQTFENGRTVTVRRDQIEARESRELV